jgi:hypothetical protein
MNIRHLAAITLLLLLLLAAAPAARAQADPVWAPVTGVPAAVTLQDVDSAGPTDAWAVGYMGEPRVGVIYRLSFRSGRWEAAREAELPAALNAVDAIDAESAWAVGEGGLIARRDASGWQVLPPPPAAPSLWAVAMRRAGGEGWAGGSISAAGGEASAALLHYVAGEWRADPSIGGPGTILDIAIDADGAWAAGTDGLWRYRDGFWAAEAPPTLCGEGEGCYTSLSGVWSPGGDEVWVAGAWGSICFACTKAGPLLAHRAAGGWQLLLPTGADGLGALRRTGPPLFAPLNDLSFADAGSGIVVGAFQDPSVPGPIRPLVARYRDGGWTASPLPGLTGALYGVTMTGRDQALAVGAGGLVLSYGYPASPLPTAPIADPGQAGVRFFGETGHTLRGSFLDSWLRYGGLARFGYPLTEEYVEDGRVVQYFERARFEQHPENAPPYDVLFGLLARELTVNRIYEETFRPAQPVPGRRFVPETGHNLAPELAAYWDRNGGLPVYGYPISEPLYEVNQADGRQYLVQYFERNRLEYHPELPEPYRVSLGLLGAEILRGRGWAP